MTGKKMGCGADKLNEFRTFEQVRRFSLDSDRPFHSAEHAEIAAGYTTDIYFVKTQEMMHHLDLEDVEVVAEIFPGDSGVFCGVQEMMQLLGGRVESMWGLPEGAEFERKEVVVRIRGRYGEFGMMETPILGMLASASGWASRGREVKEAAGERTVVCFGARHVHPAVAPVMERAAIIGGMDGCSCILGAKLLDRNPTGTVPHAAIIIAGDTARIARAYDDLMPDEDARIILVDTFKDEIEESLRIARELGERLNAVRLDTPSERGRVTPDLVRETRAKLDIEGFDHVKIFCSGGLDPDTMRALSGAGADGFGVGSYVAGAPSINMTMDLKEVNGKPVAKRGRLPGVTENPRLERLL